MCVLAGRYAVHETIIPRLPPDSVLTIKALGNMYMLRNTHREQGKTCPPYSMVSESKIFVLIFF